MRREAIPRHTTEDAVSVLGVREHTTGTTIPALTSVTFSDLQFWLIRFILEVRKNGSEYPPD